MKIITAGKTDTAHSILTICRITRFVLCTPISEEISAISLAPAGVTISKASRRGIENFLDIKLPTTTALSK